MDSSFSDAKDLPEIRPASPPAGAPNAGGVGQNRQTVSKAADRSRPISTVISLLSAAV